MWDGEEGHVLVTGEGLYVVPLGNSWCRGALQLLVPEFNIPVRPVILALFPTR